MDALLTAFIHACYILLAVGGVALLISLWMDNL